MARLSISEYVQVLVTQMELKGSSLDVAKMADDSWTQIKANKGSQSFMTNGGVNGKTGSRETEYTAIEQLDACQRALKIYLSDGDNDDEVSSTYADFSLLSR
jgi:hypothetical protein